MKNWKKTFSILLLGQLASLVGSSAAQFAIIWWLTAQTGSAVVLAMAGMCGFLPQALLGPFAGPWIDRLSRKMVMITADSFIAMVSLVLMFIALAGQPPVWVVLVILALRSVGNVFHAPALQASLPMLVPGEYLEKVTGWNQMIFSGSNLAGPVLGALLISLYSIPGVMLVDVAGAAFAVATLFFIRIPNPEPGPRQHIVAEMKEGITAIRSNPVLRRMTLPLMISMLFYFPVGTLYPLMVSGYFKKTAWHASLVEALFAAGMLIASLIVGVRGGMKNKFMQLSISISMLGLVMFFGGFLPVDGFAAFAVLSCIMGLSGTFFWLAYSVHVQTTVDPGVMGRVLSLMSSLMSLTIPFGLFLAAPFAEKLGVSVWFAISGAAIMGAGVLGVSLARKTPMAKLANAREAEE